MINCGSHVSSRRKPGNFSLQMNKNDKILFGLIKNRLRLAVIAVSALIFFSCATASAQSKPVEQGEGASSEPTEQSQAEPAKDPEDGFGYRLLAVPEYIWKGISWPIKRMSIYYEQKDLMERALDLFLNEARTGGVYPRFSLGGELSTGIGFTALVNCAVLPAPLVESELFGHAKGTFTGAINRKIGRFELADGGTLLLDEIGDLPLELLVKLLSVLQEGEF